MTNTSSNKTHETRFHKLFEDTQSMSIQGYRMDGSVVYWNAASERIYGYSINGALEKTLYDLIIPEEMRDDVKKSVAWMFENRKEIPPARLSLKHKDGSMLT
ncbi:hypothetical protein CWE15_06715 [Aliidiomarina taiwanensis]|uniref:PAS domain-containing protein n=1 Tax=Aliidiomarina taiwanensis TaxID=946228 RepID=A0A432X1K1_9GAMM|nr:PAS domain-containing protein [Aliidiomarina taiwanensis]RUO40446.1 hypothetical protein CWE15_06715 [Aliidiomarina taiwanensis]